MFCIRSRLWTGWTFGFLAVALSLMVMEGTEAHQDKEHSSPAPERQRGGMPIGPDDADPMMQHQMPMMPGMHRLMMPRMDPARGRKLFASKGCVACHAINGIGGHDATPLDAHTMDWAMNPFDFAAKMWRMAPAMIYAQEEALGAQILFTGQEMADIIAFVHHDEEQHRFSEADIPPEVRKMMNHSHSRPNGGPGAHREKVGDHHGRGTMPHHQD